MTTTNTTAFSVSTDDIISAALRQLGRLGAGATAIRTNGNVTALRSVAWSAVRGSQ